MLFWLKLLYRPCYSTLLAFSLVYPAIPPDPVFSFLTNYAGYEQETTHTGIGVAQSVVAFGGA